jgi:hypothetical protein
MAKTEWWCENGEEHVEYGWLASVVYQNKCWCFREVQ